MALTHGDDDNALKADPYILPSLRQCYLRNGDSKAGEVIDTDDASVMEERDQEMQILREANAIPAEHLERMADLLESWLETRSEGPPPCTLQAHTNFLDNVDFI